jgi:hypothetical protein
MHVGPDAALEFDYDGVDRDPTGLTFEMVAGGCVCSRTERGPS